MSGNNYALFIKNVFSAVVGFNEPAFKKAPKEIKDATNSIFSDLIWCFMIFIIIEFILVLLAFYVKNKWLLLVLLGGGVISGLLIMTILGILIKTDFYALNSAINNVVDPYKSQAFKDFLDTCNDVDPKAGIFICGGDSDTEDSSSDTD